VIEFENARTLDSRCAHRAGDRADGRAPGILPAHHHRSR
jgi:hypothetical protein